MKRRTNLPTSYGGIVIPWRKKQTCEVILTTKQSRNGLCYELPKGKREQGESKEKAAMREIFEECGLPAHQLYPLLNDPILSYARSTQAGVQKILTFWLFTTDHCGPYVPYDNKRHPHAEAIPFARLPHYIANQDDAMHIAAIQPMLAEVMRRMRGICAWDGFFAEHPALAQELDGNMRVFRRSLAVRTVVP